LMVAIWERCDGLFSLLSGLKVHSPWRLFLVSGRVRFASIEDTRHRWILNSAILPSILDTKCIIALVSIRATDIVVRTIDCRQTVALSVSA
jgi:hypothetical protein